MTTRNVIFASLIVLACGYSATIDASSINIVVLTTRDAEISAVIEALGCTPGEQTEIARRTISSVECENAIVRIVRCGAGIVNGVMTAQLMIDHFRPDLMLSIGLCAGIDDSLVVGDIALVETFDRHDVGTFTDAGFIHGTAWYRKTRIATRELMPDEARWEDILRAFTAPGDKPFVTATLATGDSFIRSSLKRSWIRQKLGAQIVDMSGAAVAAVAEANKTPLIVFRQVSDLGDDRAGAQFGQSAALPARELGDLVANTIDIWVDMEQGVQRD